MALIHVTYTSGTMANGSVINYSAPAGASFSNVKCKFKGVSTYQQGSQQRQSTKTSSNSASTTNANNLSAETTISLGSGESFVSAFRRTIMTNNSGAAATNVYIKTPPDATAQLQCASVANGATCTRQVTNGAGDLGTKTHTSTGPKPGSWRIDVYAELTYNWTYYYNTEIKTLNPKATLNGNVTQYSGYVSNGSWTSLQTMAGLVSGNNAITINVSGSGYTQFYLEFDYDRARPIVLDVMKIQTPSGAVELPIVAVDDPYLEYNYVRIYSSDAVRCVDIVDIDDTDASPVRIATHDGIKSVRRRMT